MTDLSRLSAALADRYRIERELGAGGMATVYLARDLKHDRDVAIKVLRPEIGAALGAERFLLEIKTTANLRHPHIVPLYDSGEVKLDAAAAGDGPQTLLYYVMPLVEGESLRARMDRDKQLPIDEAPETQQRDIKQLVELNRNRLDVTYLRRWASALGVDDLLSKVLT